MKKVYGYLLVSAILLVIVFGWKGLLLVGLLSPIVGFACYLESDPSPKADQNTDTASLAAASLGKENDCLGDNLDGTSLSFPKRKYTPQHAYFHFASKNTP